MHWQINAFKACKLKRNLTYTLNSPTVNHPKTHKNPKAPSRIPVPVTSKVCFSTAKFEDRDGNIIHNYKLTNLKSESAEMKPCLRGPLKAVPSSFLKRDEENKQCKEAWIKQQIQVEAKQASRFKTLPLPLAVRKQMRLVSPKPSLSTVCENKENHVNFNARLANEKLFKPKRQQRK